MNQSKRSDWRVIFSLIFAGEMIFSLPFHVARFFRPTMLDSFGLSNTDLGDIFAVYGVVAMLCYFPGGMIADYFSARRLLTVSLLTTALGGFYLVQFPEGMGLTLLFGYWGITSILLFWAGLIKATRDWGGNNKQGLAFGLLDGGRGLAGAIVSSIAVALFSSLVTSDVSGISLNEKQAGLELVIYFYTAVTALAALLIWRYIPESERQPASERYALNTIKVAIGSKQVWTQAGIIVCAYCAFKASDNYGLYLVEVLSMSHVDAATFTSVTAYLRPVGAICAGLVADRFMASRVIQWNFLGLIVIYGMMAVGWPDNILFNLAMFNLISSSLAVFALRAVYFALVEESQVNKSVTGTAVGFVSLIGFTPDIFFASVTGRILDANPGAEGFEHYFLLMMGVAVVGLMLAVFINRQNQSVIKTQICEPG